MSVVVTEEQEISCSRYLDLIYLQTGTLYDLIPHAPLLLNDPSRTAPESHVNGVVGSVINTKTASSPVQISKVNAVHSTSS